MTNEEILAKSREENQYGKNDENVKQVRIHAGGIAFIVSSLLLLIYCFIYDFSKANAYMAIIFCGIAAGNIYEAIRLKSGLYIFGAIAFSIIAIIRIIMFFVFR